MGLFSVLQLGDPALEVAHLLFHQLPEGIQAYLQLGHLQPKQQVMGQRGAQHGQEGAQQKLYGHGLPRTGFRNKSKTAVDRMRPGPDVYPLRARTGG